MSHELEEEGEVGGGDRVMSASLQLSTSSGVLSFVHKCHLNLRLQTHPSARTLPRPLVPTSFPGPAVPVGMGIWDIGV